MNSQHTIYLASKSARRRELLKQIGVNYELLLLREQPAMRCDIDETPHPAEPPLAYVKRVVLLKGETACRIMRERKLPVRPILTADTTVVLGDEIFGKPQNAPQAIDMLKKLSGETHQVITIVSVTAGNETNCSTSISEVTFRVLDEAEIRQYVKSGEPLDKAGAYGIQDRAAMFISHLCGSYSGVMGLPLYETANLLRQCGSMN